MLMYIEDILEAAGPDAMAQIPPPPEYQLEHNECRSPGVRIALVRPGLSLRVTCVRCGILLCHLALANRPLAIGWNL
jgi:hypothetical protein